MQSHMLNKFYPPPFVKKSKSHRRFTAIVSIVIFAIVNCLAQSPLDGHHIRHYTVVDGLSSNAVYSITQDSKGRMWFGTIDGLHSFDGSVIKEWRDLELKSLGSIITCIEEDNQCRLWIGSNSGLALYDMRLEKFIELPVNPMSGIRIKSPVNKIAFGKNGKAWIATSGQGIFVYDMDNEMLSQYPATAKISDDNVNDVFVDAAGQVFGATRIGLMLFDVTQDRFVPIDTDLGKKINASCIYEDRNSNLWVGTKNDGLYKYDPNSNCLIQMLRNVDGTHFFTIREIVEWQPGQLLFVSDLGFTSFDINTQEITTTHATDKRDNTINDNYLHSLYIDREGALWIGSYFGGVCYVTPDKVQFTNFNCDNTDLTAKVISRFAKGDNGNLWIGTDDNGVYQWDMQSNRFISLGNHPFMSGPQYKNIHALLQDGDRLFIGLYLGGLNILDLNTGNVTNYVAGESVESLYSSSIYSIYKDVDGVIWIGTTSGLNIYHPETDTFERVFEVHPCDVTHVVDDNKGYLWACSSNAGIYRMSRATRYWEHFTKEKIPGNIFADLPTDAIITAECDCSGNMWVGTDGHGLLRFDYNNIKFSREPLPADIRVIYKIIPCGSDRKSVV